MYVGNKEYILNTLSKRNRINDTKHMYVNGATARNDEQKNTNQRKLTRGMVKRS